MTLWPTVRRYDLTTLRAGRRVLVIISYAPRAEADALALQLGWTAPRWWQFWRWRDHPKHITT